MYKLIYTILFILSTIIIYGQEQEYYFKHYEVNNGLSHNTVHCMAQDDNGFMWFGTKNGLNRFDGHKFKHYESTLTNPLGLGSNFIQCLSFSDNKLWIGTDDGAYYYDSKFEQFHLLKPTSGTPILDIEND